MRVDFSIFDALPPLAVTRALYIDAEPSGDAWAVVARGSDKHTIGRTNKPWLAELIFNDPAGDFMPFAIATTADPAEAEFWADDCRRFYSSPDALGARLARHE